MSHWEQTINDGVDAIVTKALEDRFTPEDKQYVLTKIISRCAELIRRS